MIAGVILAAGRSARMGRPKALLPAGDGRTFVHCLLAAFAEGGISSRYVVGRADDDALREEVQSHEADYLANPAADTGGQLSSLLVALAAADRPDVRGLLVAPVDAPLIQPATVATLLAVFNTTPAPVVRACFQRRHGHPVIFSRQVFDQLRSADPAVGAKAVLRACERAILNVEVDDPGVLGDVDTPEAYRRTFGRDL